jgi:hypothetical protein
MVGPGRLELPTPRLSSVCSNQLSYGPNELASIFKSDQTAKQGQSPTPVVRRPFYPHTWAGGERYKARHRREDIS